ncbi:MAG: J domain-containing protein [Lachnospiraceae bacterium]|nr:J domain-containing protein [Lachnospiraceae bacterium]
MKKILLIPLRFIILYVFSVIYSAFMTVKYVIVGKRILGRLAILALIAGMVALGIFVRPAFFVVLGLVALFFVFTTIYILVHWDNHSLGTECEEPTIKSKVSAFFAGMTKEQAKREYRRLMKEYHPDNENGDLEMSQKISEEYNRNFGTR